MTICNTEKKQLKYEQARTTKEKKIVGNDGRRGI